MDINKILAKFQQLITEMNLFRKVMGLYVFGNVHVALNAACLVLVTLNFYSLNESKSALWVFCATVPAYSFIRMMDADRLNSHVSGFYRDNVKILGLMNLVAITGLIWTSTHLTLDELLVNVPFVLLTILYVSPGLSNFKGLRNVAGIKLFVIALVWAGVTVLFPLSVNEIPYDSSVYLIFVQRFILVLAITIPFDIRDLGLDKEDLATLPQVFGIKKSKIVGLVALLIFDLLYFVGEDFSIGETGAGIGISLLAAFLILGSKVDQNRYYSSFWVESVPMFWLLAIIAVK